MAPEIEHNRRLFGVRTRILKIVLGVLAVLAIALGVGLGVGLNRKRSAGDR